MRTTSVWSTSVTAAQGMRAERTGLRTSTSVGFSMTAGRSPNTQESRTAPTPAAATARRAPDVARSRASTVTSAPISMVAPPMTSSPRLRWVRSGSSITPPLSPAAAVAWD